MSRKNYYETLGVPRDANGSEIKAAFRKLAIRNHPDTNRDDPHAEDRFKEINEAYEILSDAVKRNRYDLGDDPFARSPASAFDHWSGSFDACGFSEFTCRGRGLGRVFGHKRRIFQRTGDRPAKLGPYRSDAHIHDLPLTSVEAFIGTERDIQIHRGEDTLVFTISIPAGVQTGALLSFKRSVGQGQEIELLFRARIAE